MVHVTMWKKKIAHTSRPHLNVCGSFRLSYEGENGLTATDRFAQIICEEYFVLKYNPADDNIEAKG